MTCSQCLAGNNSLKSYSRWFDYSRARDDMMAASDSAWAPWHAVHSDDKKRARLNIIQHILGSIDYKMPPREKIVLPKRQKQGDYVDSDKLLRFIDETF